MKRLLMLIVLISIGGLIFWNQSRGTESVQETKTQDKSETQVLGKETEEVRAIFVPYWTFGSQPLETEEFNELIYFGVAADSSGIDESDPGFEKIQDFIDVSDKSKKRFLTIRMLDQDENSKVLKSPAAQNKIISESLGLVDEYGFDGVVLDLETSSLSFESVVENITNFNKAFYQAAKKDKKLYYVALYGDTYYRARPYDIKAIGQNSDRLLIMSYDFHKARGNPGPNFPLAGRSTFGYDFKTMISDYLKEAPAGKLVPVFGYFGYDWPVTSGGNAEANGTAKSLNLIKSNFIDSCSQTECKWVRDQVSGETKVTYTDEEGENHVIWFEDEKSVEAKQKFLKEKGINSFGAWAYSYFDFSR